MFPSPSPQQVSQADAGTLNSLLPIYLPPSVAQENPQCVNLLQQLTHLLTPEGASRDVCKDLQQAEEILRHEKHGWLQSHILHREIQEMIFDYDLRGRDAGLSAVDKEFRDILEQCLNYAEAKDYLAFNPDPSSKVTLLGIQPGDLEARNPYKKHLASLQQKLIPELEDRLRQRCENFVDMFSSTSTLAEDSQDLAFAKASQLPAMVERALHTLKEDKEQLRVTRSRREKQFWLYFQTLLDSLSLLEKMVNTYRLGKCSKDNTTTTEWLTARCDAMCLKIRYLEMQILCDTYTAEIVSALQNVRDHLKERVENTEKDLCRVNLALQAYAAVGSGFDELVVEYGRLKNDLDNKQWALNEFQKPD